MGIYFGRHTAQPLVQMSRPRCTRCDDTDHVGCQVAPHSRHPGHQQVLAPSWLLRPWPSSRLESSLAAQVAPSAKFSPPSGQILKFIPHYEYVWSLCPCLHWPLVRARVWGLWQCLQSHVCIRVCWKKWNQSCMSQLLQLFQATLTIRITVWFVTMSSLPLESSQPKNCGNIRKVNWNSFSISSIKLPSNGRNLYLITLINLARARVCNLHSRADKSKSSS